MIRHHTEYVQSGRRVQKKMPHRSGASFLILRDYSQPDSLGDHPTDNTSRTLWGSTRLTDRTLHQLASLDQTEEGPVGGETGGAFSLVPVVGVAPINRCGRLIRHHIEYGQSGRRVQMKKRPLGWWSPPPRPTSRTRAIRLFDRSDFTRFSPALSAYRLHSGVERRLECLSLPWMPRDK